MNSKKSYSQGRIVAIAAAALVVILVAAIILSQSDGTHSPQAAFLGADCPSGL